jgi:hypothetical protein
VSTREWWMLVFCLVVSTTAHLSVQAPAIPASFVRIPLFLELPFVSN